jgi:2-enoate reductase
MNLHMGRCALNPRTLDESKYPVRKAKRPRKIAVIGGGIGGIEFALQASKRGHMVDLYEKTGELGGVFIAAAAPILRKRTSSCFCGTSVN